MNWYTVFFVGVAVGMLVLLLFGQAQHTALPVPEIRWTVDVTKYLFSLFIAVILFVGMFWYFS